MLEQDFHALTRCQRCADWLLLLNLRITDTIEAKVLLRDNGIRNELGIYVPAPTQLSKVEWMQQFCEGWFSQRHSTEAMERGSGNCNVHKALLGMEFITGVYNIGLMNQKEKSGLACSADSVELLEMLKVTNTLYWTYTKYVTGTGCSKYAVCTVKIKTRLTDWGVNEISSNIRSTPYVFEWNYVETMSVI